MAATALNSSEVNDIVRSAQLQNLHVHFSTGLAGLDYRRIRALPIAREPLFYIEPYSLTRGQAVIKRGLDLVAASGAMIVGSPFFLASALAIKVLGGKGPVIFRQVRVGQDGKEITVYKFRTMVVNAEAMKAQLRAVSEQDGPAFKLKNDPRVTRIGRFLRRSCIDELPQLWNVVRGDMSIVGPRPMCSKEASQCAQWERRRLDVTPGLTCIWQVHGGTKVTFTEWMRMDLRYAGSRSLWEDLRLIAQTVPSIIRRDGVY